MSKYLPKLLYKIKNCARFEYLYKLEDDFNLVGLTMQRTASDSMVLCKIIDGKPCTTNIIDDYIFIGSINEKSCELSDKMAETIIDFVMNSVDEPAVVDYAPRKWQSGVLSYGKIIIVSESVDRIVQKLDEDNQNIILD